jgi:hypothetical protein
MANWKDESKRDWRREPGLTMDDIKIGCFQRIADATELMAQNYSTLIEERERYRCCYNEASADLGRLRLSCAALRGVITKLKKRLGGRRG